MTPPRITDQLGSTGVTLHGALVGVVLAMNPDWQSDPAYADLRRIAETLEKTVSAANAAILSVSGIDAGSVVDRFAVTHARLLNLDPSGQEALRIALEEKRVQTLAQGNVFAACVLSSAVALGLFRHLPRHVSGGLATRIVEKVRPLSTHGLTLSAYALTTLYATIGVGVFRKLRKLARERARDSRQ